jgi:hypothetical protein
MAIRNHDRMGDADSTPLVRNAQPTTVVQVACPSAPVAPPD